MKNLLMMRALMIAALMIVTLTNAVGGTREEFQCYQNDRHDGAKI